MIVRFNHWADAVCGKFFRPIKKPISIRVDADVLAWFKAQDGRYQARMNEALRQYMQRRRKRGYQQLVTGHRVSFLHPSAFILPPHHLPISRFPALTLLIARRMKLGRSNSLSSEEEARKTIDALLVKAGWRVADVDEVNNHAQHGNG